ncbi:hypothetical protein RIF29_11508 [Crotalaria pallida]|uniref:F-box domain-containing protein n=1 Tax=Crotalaria pallida TaxID=3830 RepID=A0AAN9IM80_CROPI
MSFSSSPQEQELIPSLPNDIALNILARVPRSQHPSLSLVSKPIRSLLSSPPFFAARTALHSTESIFYLTSLNKSESWYALYRHPNNIFAPFPIPPIPSSSYPHDAAFAVLGPNIYVIGGTLCSSGPPSYMSSFFCSGEPDIPSAEVWVLDCRFNRWGPGPTMLTARSHAIANVVDGKIYVMGGVSEFSRGIKAEVLDPAVGNWVELPCPFHIRKPTLLKERFYFRDRCVERNGGVTGLFVRPIIYPFTIPGEASAVVDEKVYINTQVHDEIYHQVVFDTRSGAWDCVVGWENKLYLGPVLVDGVIYDYNRRGKIRGFDVKKRTWMSANIDGRAESNTFIFAHADGKFILIWGDEVVKCNEIEVHWNGDGELLARICSTHEIVSIPRHYAKQHCLAVVL